MNDLPTYKRLGGLNTEAATPVAEAVENIRVNGCRGLPKFEQIPGFCEPKDWPVALAGGGPSIRRHLDQLRQFPTIVSCGSSHDYLMEQGIVPTFAVVCDPDPVMQAYLKNPSQKTIYLLSTHCNPGLFDHLSAYRVARWHSYTDENAAQEAWAEVDGPNWHAVNGGCTVGLRSISLMLMLGFKDFHFFGFDSCIEEIDGEVFHHAYQYATDCEEMQKVHIVKTGTDAPGQKTYICEGYQLAQAVHFKQFVTAFGSQFHATFHGGGLIADWYESVKQETKRLEAQAA
jgi:hypothetical protein